MELTELTPSELLACKCIMRRFELMGYTDIDALELAKLVHTLNIVVVSIEERFENLTKALCDLGDSMSKSFKTLYEECDENDVFESYWWSTDNPRPAFNITNNYFKNQDYISRQRIKQINLARRML